MSRNVAAVRVGPLVFAAGDGVLIALSCTRTRLKKGSSIQLTLADNRFELANSIPLPTADAPVAINAAWGPQGRLRRIFTGRASTMTATLSPGRIEIQGVDASKRAKLVERARVRATIELEQIAREVADDLGVTLDAPSALLRQIGPFASVLQHGETDWDVLVRLCDAVGVDAWVEGGDDATAGVLYLRQTGAVDETRPPVVLRAGENILSWSVEIEAKTRRTTSNVINLKGVPVLEGASEAVQARAVQLANTGVVLASDDAPSFSDDTIQRALKAGAKQRRVFVATVTIAPAIPELTPRSALFVEGMGARYNGAWVIESITDDMIADRQTLTIYSDGAP